jgi:hypothetical protein
MLSLILNFIFVVSLCHVASFILCKSGMEKSQILLLYRFKVLNSEVNKAFHGFQLYKSAYNNSNYV